LEEEDTHQEATSSALNLQPNGEEEEEEDYMVLLRVRANLHFTFH